MAADQPTPDVKLHEIDDAHDNGFGPVLVCACGWRVNSYCWRSAGEALDRHLSHTESR